jgi:hypothetical protein
MNVDAWLIHTVTVAAATGRSGSGDPTYGSQSTVPARVEKNVRLRIGEQNDMADVHVIVTKTQINISSRVWLPGDDTSATAAARRPLAIKNAPTKDGGFTLYETYFAA